MEYKCSKLYLYNYVVPVELLFQLNFVLKLFYHSKRSIIPVFICFWISHTNKDALWLIMPYAPSFGTVPAPQSTLFRNTGLDHPTLVGVPLKNILPWLGRSYEFFIQYFYQKTWSPSNILSTEHRQDHFKWTVIEINMRFHIQVQSMCFPCLYVVSSM